jgi:hypothetical protein
MRFLVAALLFPFILSNTLESLSDPRTCFDFEGTVADYVARECFLYADSFLKYAKESK